MKLSTKCRYGLRAALEIARRYDTAPTKRKDIAEKEGISTSYLENILLVLRNSKIVEATRGSNGGYVLCRMPALISVYDIVSALEGDVAIVECVDKPEGCVRSGHCISRTVWCNVSETIRTTLKKISLQQLIDREKEDGMLDYSI